MAETTAEITALKKKLVILKKAAAKELEAVKKEFGIPGDRHDQLAAAIGDIDREITKEEKARQGAAGDSLTETNDKLISLHVKRNVFKKEKDSLYKTTGIKGIGALLKSLDEEPE